MRILAIIPARGGSKRLENKNRLPLLGRPLLEYTIDAAKKSTSLSKVMLSSDDADLIEIARNAGIEVPFVRPKELSGDQTGSFEVLMHAIDYYRELGKDFDAIIMLQPTSPLRISDDIDKAISLLKAGDAQSIVSVCKSSHSPLWMNTLPEDGSMKDFLSKKELKHTRSQDLPDYYRLNGAVYVAKLDYFIENKGFFGDATKAYIMPEERSVDIDDKWDFLQAEAFMRVRENT